MSRPAPRSAALLLCLCLCGASTAAEPCPAEVRVSLPNFEIAPYVLGTDKVEHPPGLLIEWTRNALRAAGCAPRVVVKRRPPDRQLAELEMGLLDVLPGFAYSASARKALAYPMKNGAANPRSAVMADTVSLYVRANERRVRWDGVTLSSPNPVVGSSTGGAMTAGIARQHSWKLESAATPEYDLHKLTARRIDVILEPDVVAAPYLTGPLGRAVRKLEPPVQVTYRYAPVNADFAARYPEFTHRFWRQLCRQSRTHSPSLPECD